MITTEVNVDDDDDEILFSCISSLECTVYVHKNSRIFCIFKAFQILLYTVNHKKRDILFFTITLANLNRFSQFFYHFNREEILHATVIKFSTSPIYVRTLPGKI